MGDTSLVWCGIYLSHVGFGRSGMRLANLEIRYVLRQVRMRKVLQAHRFIYRRFRRSKEGKKISGERHACTKMKRAS